MNNREPFLELVRSRRPCIVIQTFEEDYALGLVHEAALALSRPCWVWSVERGLREGLVTAMRPVPETADPVAALTLLAEREGDALCVTLDLAPHLRNERVLRALRFLIGRFTHSGAQLVMIDHSGELPDVVSAYAIRFELALPDEAEIESLIRAALRRANARSPIDIDIPRRAWTAIVRNLRGLTRRQIEQIIHDTVILDRRLDENDLNTVLARKRQVLQAGGLLEYVESPVSLEQIGGLHRLKSWLALRRAALTDGAVEFGLSPPRGILLLGVQGAGKSLCAKAVATAWQRPLLRMDVGALYDRYVGESERRLRDSLRQAEGMAPAILWIDEIEKAFASAASQSSDGGLSRRMFGELLTWMQEHRAPVFLVATANDIEALPPELLRKGRFDEIFFVDLPGPQTRREIFEIHLRKRKRDPASFDLDKLAAASEGYSGAEIEQAVVAGLYAAFAAGAELDTQRLIEALEGSPPLSVTLAERVESLRQWAAGRCVPAG
jgi:ATP-dependent 26S proteasome regulatory subunit